MSNRLHARLMSCASVLMLCHCGNGGQEPSSPGMAGNDGASAAAGSGGLDASVGASGGTPSVGGAGGLGGNFAIDMNGASSGGRGAGTPAGTSGTQSLGSGGTGSAGMTPTTGSGSGGAAMAGASGATAGDGGAPMTQSAMPSSGCGKSDVPPSGSMTIDVDGTQREYVVTVPSGYDPNKPYRLIFAWHGLGGTAMQMMQLDYYGLGSRSMNSAIFIAGQGLNGTGQQSGFASWANTDDADITFTRKMLEWAEANYCVDATRVFSVGMSNGGMMSDVVGCELGDVFRAIMAMSGGGPQGYAMGPCKGEIAAWISHGNMDDNVPFSYGQMSRDYWTKANHCGTTTTPVMPGTCVEYQGCDAGFPVQWCEFDGGHMVPSFAGEAGWNFFSQF